ncbi:MAG: hypothetical protein AB7O32_05770 [Vicinamibacterales bacterium]
MPVSGIFWSAARTQSSRADAVLAFLLVVLALTPIAFPFARPGFPHGHDAAAHLANFFRFDRALAQGQFPVRWVEGLAPGSGQPLFNFYQGGFYYFADLLRLAGLPRSDAFELAPVLLCWIGALFAWLWLRPFGVLAACAGSVTFVLSPYLIVDLFVRAAYPELAAIVWTVGALWAGDAFLRDGRCAHLAAFAALLALMLVSHLPATLIAAPLLAAQAIARAAADPAARARLARLTAGAFLGAGLAAFYVMPALWEMDLVNMHRLTTGGVDYRQHFVPASIWAPHTSSSRWNAGGTMVTDPTSLMPVHVGLVQWAAWAGGGLLLAVRPWRRRGPFAAATVAGWLLVSLYALFMMHAVSRPVWEAIPALSFIQFPWRFFLVISIAGAGLTAALVSRLHGRRAQVILAILIVGLHVHLYHRRLQPPAFIPTAEMNIDVPGWSGGPGRAPRASRAYEELGYDPAGATPLTALPARWSVDGPADVDLLRNDDARMELRVMSRVSEVPLRLNIPQFPGWRVTVDDRPVPVSRTAEGYMQVVVPSGEHEVRATFANTPVRTVANGLSVASVLAIVALSAGVTGRRRPRSGRP